MTQTRQFAPPGWGTWEWNRAHNPMPVTRLTQDLYREPMGRGFQESFDLFGAPIVSLTMGFVHGFDYLRMQFIGEPGEGGVLDPNTIPAEVGRRTEAAGKAFATKIWRDVMRRWDDELKPGALARHKELAAVDVAGLDDAGLAAHIDTCIGHHTDMAYLHHRFNTVALVPVGDFALNAARWTGRPPELVLGLFQGHSAASGIWSDEIAPAAHAVAAHPSARALLDGEGDAGARLAQLRELVPDVDEYLRTVGYRLVDGFDFLAPTLIESPAIVLGKLAAAVEMGGPADTAPVEKLEAEIRAEVPEEHRAEFDDLLAEARHVYRLRDERGIYSDMSSAGLLRLAILELGRRLVTRGVIDDAELVLHAGADEVRALATGASEPDGVELTARAEERLAAGAEGAPPLLGPPHGPPPPPEALPPPLARVAGAIGFLIPAVLGQIEEPSMEGNVIKGLPGSGGVFEGRARLVRDYTDLLALEPGEVLVTKVTSEAFSAGIHLCGAIVTDHGGVASHAAITSREVGIPAVVGTGVGTKRIPHGATVVVDGDKGEVTIRS